MPEVRSNGKKDSNDSDTSWSKATGKGFQGPYNFRFPKTYLHMFNTAQSITSSQKINVLDSH